MAMPVMAMPVPSPVPVMPVPVPAPAHLFGLDVIDIVLGDDRGLCGFAGRGHDARHRCSRRQRRRIRAHSNRRGTGGEPNSEFQKVAAFHDISLFMRG